MTKKFLVPININGRVTATDVVEAQGGLSVVGDSNLIGPTYALDTVEVSGNAWFDSDVTLGHDPTAALQAATKQYVDGKAAAAGNEVFIGPSDPGFGYEVWYDSDAPDGVAAGVGLPTGGTAGQVLAKNSGTNYDASWLPQTGQRVGSVTVAADQAGIGATETVLTGFSITFTAVAGRRYKLEYVLSSGQVTTGGATQQFNWRLDGVTQSILDRSGPEAAGNVHMVSGFQELIGLAAGSRTVVLTGTTHVGTMTIYSGSLTNGRMIITDIGT